mmetsp:Transcript_38344/g.90122  ORF Transcript_38344/g.90122 Transcript_38344/m.90122 type:complete len:433 (-) Transcript_38344:85-1383(-)
MSKLDLCCTSSRDKRRVLGNAPNDIDCIVNGSLHLLQHIRAGAAQHQSCNLGVSSLDDGELLRGNLIYFDGFNEAELLWQWSASSDNGSRTNGAADPPELKLRSDLQSKDAILVQVVQGYLRDSPAANHHVDACILEGFDELLHSAFLALGEVQQLLCVLQQYSSLGLSALGFQARSIHGDLCILLEGLDATGLSRYGHAIHDEGRGQSATVDLGDAHIVHVEPARNGRHHLHTGLCHHQRKLLVVAQLPGSEGGVYTLPKLLDVPHIRAAPTFEAVENFQYLASRQLIAFEDVCCMNTLLQELLGAEQQLAAQADNEVRAIPALFLLSLCGQNQEFGGRVHDLKLRYHCVCITGDKVFADVIHNELVHAIGPQTRPGDLRQVLARLDVAQQGFIHAREVLPALLEKPLKSNLLIEHLSVNNLTPGKPPQAT